MNETQIKMAAEYVVKTTPLEHLRDIDEATRMIARWVKDLEDREEGYVSSASYILHKETDEDGSVAWEFDHKVFTFYDDGDYFSWQS